METARCRMRKKGTLLRGQDSEPRLCGYAAEDFIQSAVQQVRI